MKSRQKDTRDKKRQPRNYESVIEEEKLYSQGNVVRRGLTIATVLVGVNSVLIISHEVFVLLNWPESGIHGISHVLLLCMVLVIIIANIVLWLAYNKLSRFEAAIITSHARLEEEIQARCMELEKSDSLLLSMFNAFEERTVVVSSDLRIFRANKVAIEWVGYDPTGHLFAEVFAENDPASERRSENRQIKATFDSASPQRNRLIRNGKDSTSVFSINTYPVLDSQGEVRSVIQVASDVTKEMENDILARHREKMTALGMLAAGFAHELGNPLTSLSTELELLERNPDEQNLRQSITLLKDHLGRINRILHQVRGFAQKRSTEAREANIGQVIADVLHLVSFDPRAQGIKIHVDVSDKLHPVLMSEDDFYLVLINLIINAFEAMPDGGTLTITANTDRTGGSCLTVSDSGVGMEESVLSRAAFPLFTTKHDAVGMGLGLSICRDLLHAAGARLNILSTVGKGTTVKVDFPGPDNKG